MINLIKAVVLSCDVTGCESVYTADGNVVGPARVRRQAAATHGWQWTGIRDVCPNHEKPFNFAAASGETGT